MRNKTYNAGTSEREYICGQCDLSDSCTHNPAGYSPIGKIDDTKRCCEEQHTLCQHYNWMASVLKELSAKE